MENIKRVWQLNNLEAHGALIVTGYVAAAVLFLATYIRFF